MIIGGFEALTLTDFPGRVAAIVFTVGCNLRCPYCYNKDLITKKWFRESDRKEYDEKKVLNYLKKNRSMLDGVVITGGEPLLNSSIVKFCRDIKDMGLDVKIDTNGTNPEILQKLVCQELVDYIAMDIKAPLNKYDLVGFKGDTECIKRSIEIIKSSGLAHEFRVSMHPKLKFEDYEKICKLCNGSNLFFQDLMYDAEFLDNSIKDVPGLTREEKVKLKSMAHCNCIIRYT